MAWSVQGRLQPGRIDVHRPVHVRPDRNCPAGSQASLQAGSCQMRNIPVGIFDMHASGALPG
jgi:hypothetical protein